MEKISDDSPKHKSDLVRSLSESKNPNSVFLKSNLHNLSPIIVLSIFIVFTSSIMSYVMGCESFVMNWVINDEVKQPYNVISYQEYNAFKIKCEEKGMAVYQKTNLFIDSNNITPADHQKLYCDDKATSNNLDSVILKSPNTQTQ